MRILSSYSLIFPLAGLPSASTEVGGRMGKMRKHLLLEWCSHCSLIGTWGGIARGVACGPHCTRLWCQTQHWTDHFQPHSASSRSLLQVWPAFKSSFCGVSLTLRKITHSHHATWWVCRMPSVYSVISLQFLSHTSKFRGQISKSILKQMPN